MYLSEGYCKKKTMWNINGYLMFLFYSAYPLQVCLFLPVISFSKLAFNTADLGALAFMLDHHVTDTLVWMWTVCMAPLGQKVPIVAPFSSATSIVTLSSHSCPGRDCLRGPVGEISFTVPCWPGRSIHVTRLRGAGRHDGSRGTDRLTGSGHLPELQSERKEVLKWNW